MTNEQQQLCARAPFTVDNGVADILYSFFHKNPILGVSDIVAGHSGFG